LAARSVPDLERVKAQCLKISSKIEVEILQLDLSNPDKVLEIAPTLKCDLLFNNAGVSQRTEFKDCDFKLAKYMMDVNCMGPIALIKGVCQKYMETYKQETSELQVVNILSVAALVGVPMRTFYSSSKFAFDGFSKSFQAEMRDKNVYVTNIYPAYVQTNISKNAMTGDMSKMGKTDQNISSGIPVESAVEDILKSTYQKRYWVTIGSLKYQIGPKLLALSENLTSWNAHHVYKN